MQPISTCLWFNNQAEEAANFYTGIFPETIISNVMRYGQGMPGEPGSVMAMTVMLNSREFIFLNGNSGFVAPGPAVSFFIKCNTQDEVDHYWDKLVDGGTPIRCGWLTDKYGITWQVVPVKMQQLMGSGNPQKSQKVAQAMMKMIKLDLNELQRVFDEA